MCIIILTIKIEKYQLRDNNSVCTGSFQLLRDHATAQLRGNIALQHPVRGVPRLVLQPEECEREVSGCIGCLLLFAGKPTTNHEKGRNPDP
jgi:hypothetical protein